MDRLLIRGGCVIDTEPAPGVTWPADVLIENGRVAAVGPDLPADAEVIDARDRIVLPGFVDTHRHTWQAAVRTTTPDGTLADYLALVRDRLGPRHRPTDVYAAELAGALECLDAGITTVVDWSHIQLSPEHTDAAVEALRRAGIRAVFAYCPGSGPAARDPMPETRRVADLADDLITVALAAMGPEHAGPDQTREEWRLARELGLAVTAHVGGYGRESAERGLDLLRREDLLGNDVLLAHANAYSDEAFRLLADTGGAVAACPLIEPQMGHGHPVTGRARAAGVPTGLGADVVTAGPGDMFAQMRTAYVLERGRPDDSSFPDQPGRPARPTSREGMGFTTRDALAMATSEGARAAGLADVGSLRPGNRADLVLLRTDLLAMTPVHDPIAAVVLSADTRSVDTVLVGGRVVKRDGALVGHDMGRVLAELRASAAHIAAAQ
jgi:cytosine/adenosine deaminase-related metal-dependent hydrolase